MRNILAVSVLGLQTDSVHTAEVLAFSSSKEKRTFCSMLEMAGDEASVVLT